MLSIDWDYKNGWHKPVIQPYGPISLAVTATSLHYGISAFETISVCKNEKDGKLQGFRPSYHIQSLFTSSEHLDLPSFDTQEMLECLKQLVKLDKEWIPEDPDIPIQMYSRMNHISTDEMLGVRTPKASKIYAICSPLLMRNKTIRVKCNSGIDKHWPLGHGEFRISGNFGPLVPTIADAKQNGFDDVLWTLDDYIKELTILNVFVVWKSRYGEVELLTPPIDGCIFNGSIRKSIVEMKDQIFKDKGIKLVERQISIHEIINAYNEGRMMEMFGAATQSSIQPFSSLVY